MDSRLKRRLSQLPRLGSRPPEARKCKVCGERAPFFDIADFNKACLDKPYEFGISRIQVSYYRCLKCHLLFTDFIDEWTQDDIEKFIYNEDYIRVDPAYLMQRPSVQAKEMAILLEGCEGLHILDYGSGSGQFARQLQDYGFPHVTSYDPFSNPIRPDRSFDLVTAFEVAEHSPQPLQTFREMSEFTRPNGAIVVGQSMQPPNIEEVRCGWWYIGPRNGHVSTYTARTFWEIARRIGFSHIPMQGYSGVCAFIRGTLPEMLARAMARIGSAQTLHVLGAPGEGSRSSPPWHALEDLDATTKFRWSAEPEVGWDNCIFEVGLNRIEVPFIMEIHDQFAQGCKLRVDGFELPTSLNGQCLVAEIESGARGGHLVELVTPPPLSPRETRRSVDGRKLGLAVPVESI